jgi:hypothetical protein
MPLAFHPRGSQFSPEASRNRVIKRFLQGEDCDSNSGLGEGPLRIYQAVSEELRRGRPYRKIKRAPGTIGLGEVMCSLINCLSLHHLNLLNDREMETLCDHPEKGLPGYQDDLRENICLSFAFHGQLDPFARTTKKFRFSGTPTHLWEH